LIVDIRMPGVDGFEVVDHIKRLQPDSSVLIMTGHGTIEIAIRALREGVDGLLLKPFGQGSELVDAARLAMLDNQQKRDAARIQTLRPLFSVTEALLSETRRERLLDLILDAICNHLNCLNAACYQPHIESKSLDLVTSRGKILPDTLDLFTSLDASTGPLLIQAGQADTSLTTTLVDLGLGSAILVPILHVIRTSRLSANQMWKCSRSWHARLRWHWRTRACTQNNWRTCTRWRNPRRRCCNLKRWLRPGA
jgi:CheY-like chemotaxis protein